MLGEEPSGYHRKVFYRPYIYTVLYLFVVFRQFCDEFKHLVVKGILLQPYQYKYLG
jgi:hypothetical protein